MSESWLQEEEQKPDQTAPTWLQEDTPTKGAAAPFVPPSDKREAIQQTVAELQAKQRDTVKSAQAYRLSRQEGLPMEIAYDQAEKLVSKRTNWDAWRKDAPAAAKFWSDPDRYSMLEEADINKMSGFEKAWKQLQIYRTQNTEQLEMADIGARMLNGTATKQDERRLYELRSAQAMRPELTDSNFVYGAGVIDQAVKSTGQSFLRSWDEILAGAGIGAATGATIGGATGTVTLPGFGTAVGAGGGAVIGGTAGAATGLKVGMMSDAFNQVAGQAYLDAKEMLDENGERINDDLARGVAIFTGLAGGGLELFSLKMLKDSIPGLDNLLTRKGMQELVVKAQGNSALRASLIALAKASAGEGLQEVGEQVSQVFASMAAGGKYDAQGNEIAQQLSPDQLASTFGWGAVGGAGISVGLQLGTKTAKTAWNFARTRAEAKQKSLVQLGDAIRKTGIAQRSPEAFGEYMQALEEGAQSQVTVAPEALTKMFQDMGLTDDQVQEQFPELKQPLADAAEAGADVNITPETFAKLAQAAEPAVFEEFSKDLRAGPEELTAREAEVEAQGLEEMIAAMPEEEKAKAVEASLVEEMTTQLVEAGTDAGAARKQAKLLVAGQMALAQRAGMTVDQLAQRYKVEVKGAETAGPDAMQQPDVTSSPAFQRWFEGSQVVDETGAPLKVFHGTGATNIESFITQRQGSTRVDQLGSWFTNKPDYAGKYAATMKREGDQWVRSGGQIMPVYLSLRMPWVVEGTKGFDDLMQIVRRRGDPSNPGGEKRSPPPEGYDMNAVRDYFLSSGFDSIIIKNFDGDAALSETGEAQDVYIALYPDQIKSVFNRGTFDRMSDNILFQSAGDVIYGGEGENDVQQARDGRGRYSSGSLAPLEGAPRVRGASGPDRRLVAVAETYAQEAGIPLKRQAEFVAADPERGARIAEAYAQMEHAPGDPVVREAYNNLIQQTIAQYKALERAGYKFWFFDDATDPYEGNPWNAMRDLRANQSMGVYSTQAGFGTLEGFDASQNPLLVDTGIKWPFGSPDGELRPVYANDLFRAVHDAFGHGLEGAGFRADGEENAWQAHVRLFTGSAVAAITTETRGQNSWLNFGPYGETNRTASVEETVFADQKTGLMPEWTWTEGRAADEVTRLNQDVQPVFYSAMLRGVEGAKQPKAPAAQWMGILKNMPGVKQEELDWLGVEDWLKSQDGTVTREALADYIRANQIEIQEVALNEDAAQGMEADVSLDRDWEDVEPDPDYIREQAVDIYLDDLVQEIADAEGIDPSEVDVEDTGAMDDAIQMATEAYYEDYERPVQKSGAVDVGDKTYSFTVEMSYGDMEIWSPDINGGEQVYSGTALDDPGIEEQMRRAAYEDAGIDPDQDLTPKYEDWALPGGSNYTELLLTLPDKPGRPYHSGHFDQENILAHVRFDERIEEIALTVEEKSRLLKWERDQEKVRDLTGQINARGSSAAFSEEGQEARSSLAAKVRAGELSTAEAERQFVEAISADHPDIKEMYDRRQALIDGMLEKPQTRRRKILFIQEIQSDWHQAGRDYGYQGQRKIADTTGFQVREEPRYGDRYWIVTKANGEHFFSTPWRSNETPEQAIERAAREEAEREDLSAVPNAPLKTTWPELAFKRMLRYAVDNGFDQIAWTPGSMQIDRYQETMRQNVDEIAYRKVDLGDGTSGYSIAAMKDGSFAFGRDGMNEQDLRDVLGKELADRILNDEGEQEALYSVVTLDGQVVTSMESGEKADKKAAEIGGRVVKNTDRRVLRGDDLAIGGEGMKTFYDKMLPKMVAKMTKKMGGEVSVGTIPGDRDTAGVSGDMVMDALPEWSNKTAEERSAYWRSLKQEARDRLIEEFRQRTDRGHKVWTLPITDEMRAAVPQGLPLFQTGDQPRGFIEFTKARDIFKITLTGNANLSTFLHESGHYFLEVMTDLVESGQGNIKMAEDLQLLKDWAGVGPDGRFGVEQHEKFARGFEAYLMGGSAPSSGLKALFHRFKGWLTFIYKSAQNLNVELTPEVREVMDRMLATDEEIAKARKNVGRAEAPMDQEAMGLTDAEYEQYIKLWEASQEAETARLDARQMNEFKQGQKESFKNEVQRNIDAMQAELEKTKGYQTWIDLRDRETKLQRDTLTPEQRQLAFGLHSSEGVDADSYATAKGYDNGLDMLKDIQATKERQKQIPQIAEEMARKAHGFMDEKSIEDAAQMAIHDKEAQEVALLEYMAITSRDGRRARKGFADWINAQARQRVGSLTRRQLEPAKWRRAEVNAAAKSAAALAKGDKVNAALAKRQQIMASAMYRATLEANERFETIRNKLMPFTSTKRRARLGKAGPQFRDAVDEIMESISFKRITGKEAARQSSLREMIQYAQDNQLALNVPDKMPATDYASMTLNDLETVHDVVMNIWKLAKKSETALLDGRRVEFDTIMSEAERTAALMGSLDRPTKNVEGKMDDVKNGIRKFRASLVKPEFIFGWLDGTPAGGVLHKVLFQPFVDAQKASYDLFQKFKLNLIDPMRAMPAEQKNRWAQKMTVFGNKDSNGATIIAAALNLGNELNKQRLMKGLNMTEDQVMAEINRFMTKEDWDMVQLIWDQVDTLWPMVESTAEKATGLKPEKSPALPIQTPYGEYRGGYYPIVYDRRVSKLGDRMEAASDELFGNDFLRNPVLANGFTKGRVEDVPGDNPLLLDMSVLSRHLGEVIHYVTHYEAVDQANRLLRRTRFKNLVKEHLGDEYNKTLQRWLLDIARNQDSPTETKWEAVSDGLRWLRGGTSIATMGYNLFTASKQLLGLTTALDAIPARYVLQGIAKMYLAPMAAQKSSWKFAMEKSKELRPLIKSFDRDVRMVANTYAQKTTGKVIDKIVENAFVPMGYVQATVNVAIWQGSFDQAQAKGMTEAEAVNYADAIVRQTQGSGGIKDLAAVQRSSEGVRLMTMFYSWMSVMYNRLEDMAREQKRMGVRNVPRLARRLTVAFMLTTMIEEAGRRAYEAAMGGEDDEDDPGYALSVLLKTGDLIVGTVPFFRTFFSFESQYRKELTPVSRGIDDIDRTLKALADLALEGEPLSRSEGKAAARGLSVATRKPVYGVYRMFDEWFGEDVFDE